jgi:hypothetical protein
MDNQIIEIQSQQKPLTTEEILWQVEQIQTIMKSVMKQNVDYGTIPGCKLPTLLKPGSEILLTTFHIASKPEVTDLSTPDKVHYRVVSYGYYKDGTFVGTGVGECSSDEEKYKWRRAINDQEWNEAPADRRREKWCKGKDGKPDYKIKQIRTEIADLANTVLKMAKKRSQIDLTLTCTGASRLFTQDIEDMPEEIINQSEQHATPSNANQTQSKKGYLSEAQVKRFYAIQKKAESNGALPEVVKVIQDAIVPENRTPDGKFDWNKVTKQQYDTLCNLFESGEWKKKYQEISELEEVAKSLDDIPF